MPRMLLDHDPLYGITQWIEPDEDGATIITSSDVTAALDMNKRCQGVNNSIRRGDQTWGHHVASIPFFVWEQWCRENPELRLNTKDAQVWLINRLNNSEWCHLRTYDGKV